MNSDPKCPKCLCLLLSSGKCARCDSFPVAAAPRTRWVRKLIEAGVANLREFGYPSCSAENITTDAVFAALFAEMLRDNAGKSADYDEAIESLLGEIAERGAA
jgi:hypothetical protein